MHQASWPITWTHKIEQVKKMSNGLKLSHKPGNVERMGAGMLSEDLVSLLRFDLLRPFLAHGDKRLFASL
jgi:hypothetical protein